MLRQWLPGTPEFRLADNAFARMCRAKGASPWRPGEEDLLRAIRLRLRGWGQVLEKDLEFVIANSEKVRHENQGTPDSRPSWLFIARRRHEDPAGTSDLPYDGSPASNREKIVQQGLRPMSRRHVHLSEDRATAIEVGPPARATDRRFQRVRQGSSDGRHSILLWRWPDLAERGDPATFPRYPRFLPKAGSAMKMYILIKESVPIGFALVAAAHASLAAYLRFREAPETSEWLGPVL